MKQKSIGDLVEDFRAAQHKHRSARARLTSAKRFGRPADDARREWDHSFLFMAWAAINLARRLDKEPPEKLLEGQR